jgi:hypothetical protein
VSYRAVGLALPDLMASQIELTVVPLAAALPLARDGRIKLLAVTTPERAVAAPDVAPMMTAQAAMNISSTSVVMPVYQNAKAPARTLTTPLRPSHQRGPASPPDALNAAHMAMIPSLRA